MVFLGGTEEFRINDDEDACEEFFATEKNHEGTKVGGFPTEIQYEVGLEGYVFQVGSEEKAGWIWAGDGIGYFFRKNGEWKFDCQCY